MDWRGLQQKIANFWHKVPEQVRRLLSVVLVVWRVLGWIEEHVARLILLIIIIGALAAGGALVIGVYLSEVDPLWIYVGSLASVAILIWGAAGIATLVRASIPAPSGSATIEPVTEEPRAEEDEITRAIRQLDARTYEDQRLSDLLDRVSTRLAAGVSVNQVFDWNTFETNRMDITALADLRLYNIIDYRIVPRRPGQPASLQPAQIAVLTDFGKRVVMAIRDRDGTGGPVEDERTD